jgi:hypothetical protein
MSESKASRTLLKSPPELWSEVSTATSLQRHMDQFGEIRITKLQPETAVAWEGEHARGTITLEVSGWGTKVSLTAEPVGASGADGTGGEPVRAGGGDGTRGEAAGSPEQDPASGGVEPEGGGDRVERAPAGERVHPEASYEVESEPSHDLIEQAPAGERVHLEATESVDPPDPAGAAMPDRAISLEHDRLDAPRERPRWTRRLAEVFRKWFGVVPQEEADLLAHAPEPEPKQPAASSTPAATPEPGPVTPQPQQPTAAPPLARPPEPTLAVPEAEQPATSHSPISIQEPAPQQEPPPRLDEASAAALDAALDSLGQAHHRPFSRA